MKQCSYGNFTDHCLYFLFAFCIPLQIQCWLLSPDQYGWEVIHWYKNLFYSSCNACPYRSRISEDRFYLFLPQSLSLCPNPDRMQIEQCYCEEAAPYIVCATKDLARTYTHYDIWSKMEACD